MIAKAIDTFFTLSKEAPIRNEMFDPAFVDKIILDENKRIRTAFEYAANLQIIGLCPDFILRLPPNHAVLLIYLAEGYLIEDLETKFKTNTFALGNMGEEILEMLDRQNTQMTQQEIDFIRFCINEFLKKDIYA